MLDRISLLRQATSGLQYLSEYDDHIDKDIVARNCLVSRHLLNGYKDDCA